MIIILSNVIQQVYLDEEILGKEENTNPCCYVALGSDNTWYLFTEKWIKALYKTGFPNVSLSHGDALPLNSLKELFVKEPMQWEKLANSEFGPLYSMVGSLDTWSWSLNVPVLSSLSEDNEVLPWILEPEYSLFVFLNQLDRSGIRFSFKFSMMRRLYFFQFSFVGSLNFHRFVNIY